MQNGSTDIQQTLTQAIDQASDLHTALDNVLSIICEFTGWDYGEAWIPFKEGRILELHPVCYISPHRSDADRYALEQFRNCTKGLTFPYNVGLPGRVWASQRIEWLNNPASQSERIFLRHHIAKAFGVKTGFGVPVLAGDRVLAVLAFFMLDSPMEDKGLTELISTLTNQIGNKLENFHL
ncbi:MAG: GAF domain-containing protein [Leptolyngbyaceae cyanobacterium RU_5_1]|nr:GAF domain-containing protein [Leptolyngbyaceae cyanobacterium RU_5_1]